jgi:hypothetical protein
MTKTDQRWEQYSAMDEVTDQVNQAIILLKKAFLLSTEKEKYPRLAVSEAEELVARNKLDDLFRFISSRRHKGKHSPYVGIPEPAATNLRGKLDQLLPPRRKMIEIERCIAAGKGITRYHFQLLDDLVRALDEERSLVIQKLQNGKS